MQSKSINQSNLLTPDSFQLAKETPQLAYRFRLIGVIDKSLHILKKIIEYSYQNANDTFNEEFYQNILDMNEKMKVGDLLLNYYALFNDIPVGAICASLKSESDSQSESQNEEQRNKVIINNLCVLPAYRNQDIAKHMIETLKQKCEQHGTVSKIELDLLQKDLNDNELDEFLTKVGFRKEENRYLISL